ncbi:hypothetical protein ACQ4PT_006320 [Festuca glaucescens]
MLVVAGGRVPEREEEGVHPVAEVAGAQRAGLHRVRLRRAHRLPRRQLRLQVQRQHLPHGPPRQHRRKHTQKEARVWQVGRVQVERQEAGPEGVVQGGAAVLPTEPPPVVVALRIRERRRPRHAVQDRRRRRVPRREASMLQDRRRRHRAGGRGGEEEGDGGRGGAGGDVLALVVEPDVDYSLIMGLVLVYGLMNHTM